MKLFKKQMMSWILAFLMVLTQLPVEGLTVWGEDYVTFTFSDSEISVSDEGAEGYKISGTDLTINKEGTYVVTGSCSDGTISVKKGTTGVTLIFSDLTLTSTTSAPVCLKKTSEAEIVLQGTNVITDSEDPANEDSTDETVADAFEGAAIKVKSGASLTISGDGSLTADGSTCKNGIKGASESTITLNGGEIEVSAANAGISCDGILTIAGGTVNVTSDEEGLVAEPDEDDTASAGVIYITGGDINISSGAQGIVATKGINISGGDIDVEASKAGIKCDGVIEISGEADVYVNAAKDGINTSGSVIISGGTVEIESESDGIQGDAAVQIDNATLVITATAAGIKSDTEVTVTDAKVTINSGEEGVVSDSTANLNNAELTIISETDGVNAPSVNIDGGIYIISSQTDCIQGDNSVIISDGNFTLTAGGGSENTDSLTSEESMKGIKSDNDITITGGTFEIDSLDDCIHSDGDVNITAGTFNLTTYSLERSDDGNKGIHADYTVNIGTEGSEEGPDITIVNSYEGIEGATVNLYSGTGNITSTDDGINAANSDLTDYTYLINIAGGTWEINAEGDGIDSNDTITVSGGYTLIYGASNTSGGDTAIDYDYTWEYTGGTIIGVGMSGMVEYPTSGEYLSYGGSGSGSQGPGSQGPGSQGGSQGSSSQGPGSQGSSSQSGTSISLSEGDVVSVTDAEGNEICSFTAVKSANNILICDDDIESSETYYVYVNGTKVAESTAAGTSTDTGDDDDDKKDDGKSDDGDDTKDDGKSDDDDKKDDGGDTDDEITATVSYTTHVQTYGWLDYVSDGETSGTTGESKRLEGIKINVSTADSDGNVDVLDGSIEYCTHVQTYGWLDYVSDDELSGTTGESKRLEAIRIRITGELEENYDIYYRVHAQTFGWLGWACNGEASGTAGYAKRLEAIQIVLVKKGETFDGDTTGCYYDKSEVPVIKYTSHVQKIGWQDYVTNGETSGTVGQALRLEAVKIELEEIDDMTYGVKYCTHVQTYGWMDYVSDGELSGTEGKAKRLEAIKIELTGEAADYYDIYYRVQAQTYGWLGWACNGAASGTSGLGKRLETIEIQIVHKGAGAPGTKNNSYVEG